MAAIGAGYDLSVSTFSPDGRIFQVEYAAKAVDNGNTSVAVVCKDGILFAAERFLPNKMVVSGSTARLFAVDRHVTIAIGGFVADAREIVYRARLEAKEYRRIYDEPVPARIISERLALFLHAYTLSWSERPFGASILLGVCEMEGCGSLSDDATMSSCDNQPPKNPVFSLYSLDTAGACYKFHGAAIGKGRQLAKTEIEKLDRQNMTCEECLVPLAKLMRRVHDDTKSRNVCLEMSWICSSSNFQHATISQKRITEVVSIAQELLENEDKEPDNPVSQGGEDVEMN